MDQVRTFIWNDVLHNSNFPSTWALLFSSGKRIIKTHTFSYNVKTNQNENITERWISNVQRRQTSKCVYVVFFHLVRVFYSSIFRECKTRMNLNEMGVKAVDIYGTLHCKLKCSIQSFSFFMVETKECVCWKRSRARKREKKTKKTF